MSVFSKERLKNNILPITEFQQLLITKILEVLLILVEFFDCKRKSLKRWYNTLIKKQLRKYMNETLH